jgi:hypothetical protein
MIPIGLLIEFKDGRIKETNFGHGHGAQESKPATSSPWWSMPRPKMPKRALEAFGVARIVNISTGSRGWDPVIRAAAVVAAMEQFEDQQPGRLHQPRRPGTAATDCRPTGCPADHGLR